jgi:hypothetical protein
MHQDGREGTCPMWEQEEGWDGVLFVVIIGDLEAVVVVFLDYGVYREWHSVVRDAALQERTDFLAESSDCHTCFTEPTILLVHKTFPYRRRCGGDIMLYTPRQHKR